MDNKVEFLDRAGNYKTMHVISIIYQCDGQSEDFSIAFSGIDDTLIMTLDEQTATKLSRELMQARAAIQTIKDRKERERKKQLAIEAAKSVLDR